MQTKAVTKKGKIKKNKKRKARTIRKIKKRTKIKIGIENAKQKIGLLGLGKTRNAEDKSF